MLNIIGSKILNFRGKVEFWKEMNRFLESRDENEELWLECVNNNVVLFIRFSSKLYYFEFRNEEFGWRSFLRKRQHISTSSKSISY